ncbi:hypothetical protein PAAG_08015 [Paracoccidioides lutzii Pb01]|uniref:Inhibitor I9 domain-containing protein n=1 Tax=Paracoccidioides lutzii (strain ATCC MYA-826 / Pb01) TaxID=502779 RepID=C1HB74_PARBA|nr:hypothetical protein PAAG_08015 [Paracoccidioides lutzii Pb01]EEH37597.1 hypothetical protein PAAG_08015 [Paracoccidioides lutzii Pb01]
MKLFSVAALLALLVPAALAGNQPIKSFVVSYPDNTPDSVVDQAIEAIQMAGGFITHRYNLIKGFAATAPAQAMELVSTLGEGYNAYVEEDSTVSIYSQIVKVGPGS